jgi:hypothetical protein
MGPDFVLRGRARRIARAVVEAMGPRWPDADLDIEAEVLEEVERMIRAYPPAIQLAVMVSLFGIEFLSPLFALRTGLKPLSAVDRAAAIQRLEAIADHPIAQIRMLVMLLKIMVSFSAYSRPEVEAFLGYRRRAWRAARQAFRDRLLAADPAVLPPVPTPLADGRVVSPAEYLQFVLHTLQGPTTPAPAAAGEAG